MNLSDGMVQFTGFVFNGNQFHSFGSSQKIQCLKPILMSEPFNV
jgi:hypothetical protein